MPDKKPSVSLQKEGTCFSSSPTVLAFYLRGIFLKMGQQKSKPCPTG